MKKDAKPIEYREYIDAKSGEVFEVPVVNHIGNGNRDFEMIFYGHFLEILNDLGNKKIKVLQYIVRNKNKSENVYIGTQRDIAKNLNINVMTVNKTLTMLEDKGVIKTKSGVIYIDPDLVCDGRFKGHIMHIYSNLEEETLEEKNARLERELKRKEKEVEVLRNLHSNVMDEIIKKAPNQTELEFS